MKEYRIKIEGWANFKVEDETAKENFETIVNAYLMKLKKSITKKELGIISYHGGDLVIDHTYHNDEGHQVTHKHLDLIQNKEITCESVLDFTLEKSWG